MRTRKILGPKTHTFSQPQTHDSHVVRSVERCFGSSREEKNTHHRATNSTCVMLWWVYASASEICQATTERDSELSNFACFNGKNILRSNSTLCAQLSVCVWEDVCRKNDPGWLLRTDLFSLPFAWSTSGTELLPWQNGNLDCGAAEGSFVSFASGPCFLSVYFGFTRLEYLSPV